MAIRIERLTAEHVAAVRQLRMTQRPDDWPEQLSDDFYRWRYLDRGEYETLLAFDGDRCVAMLDSSFHMYRYDNSIVRIREPSEWFCLPEYRAQGVGLRLMRMFMQEAEPMFAMAGTWMTQDILPLLGWQMLPDAINYSLPLTSGTLVNAMFGRLRVPDGRVRTRVSHAISMPVWRSRAKPPLADMVLAEYPVGQPLPILEPASDYALACMAGHWEPAWLQKAPSDMGEFLWLVGRSADEPIGLAVGRIYERNGVSEANLLHTQTDRCSRELYRWLVSEACSVLAKRGATKVSCRASCPEFSSALKDVGFVERSRTPSFLWHKERGPYDGNMHLTMWRADEAIRPYPTD